MRLQLLIVCLCTGAACSTPWSTSVALEAARSTRVHFHAAGIVALVKVRVGDQVAAGDTLALLAAEDLRLQAQAAQLTVDRSQRHLRRMRRLPPGAMSKQTLEDAGLKAQQVRIRLEQIRLRLRHTVLLAPHAGVVAERLVEPGQPVAASSHAFSVVDPSDLQAELFIPFDRLAGVVVGQKARPVSRTGKK